MNTETAPPDDSPKNQEPAPPGSRPDHTILSILILLALSAGGLYLVDWGLREDGAVVQAWDFSQPLEDVWEVPDPNFSRSEKGITFEMEASGFGPKVALDLPAESVDRIQATIQVVHADTGRPVRFSLGWYWARESDLTETPDAPFASNRAMSFYSFARHRPDTYRVDMNTHELWNETVKAGVFTIKYPAEATGPFRVTMSHVDFLE